MEYLYRFKGYYAEKLYPASTAELRLRPSIPNTCSKNDLNL